MRQRCFLRSEWYINSACGYIVGVCDCVGFEWAFLCVCLHVRLVGEAEGVHVLRMIVCEFVYECACLPSLVYVRIILILKLILTVLVFSKD